MKRKLSTYHIVLILVIVLALGMIFIENASAITGHATTGSTYSNVTIQQYLAIEMSEELYSGIDFGSVATLGQIYNASENYNGTSPSNSTLYWINVSQDSNTAVDLCTYVNSGMTSIGGDIIGPGNESFSANTTVSNITDPSFLSHTNYTNSSQVGHLGVPVGNQSYWRFWLNAPLGQATGNYNNTVIFEGYNSGTGC
jgi:hypothetical protein